MNTERVKFYTERNSFGVQAMIILMALSIAFRLIGCWGLWNDRSFALAQIALPIGSALLLMVFVWLLGRRALWLTFIPVILGALVAAGWERFFVTFHQLVFPHCNHGPALSVQNSHGVLDKTVREFIRLGMQSRSRKYGQAEEQNDIGSFHFEQHSVINYHPGFWTRTPDDLRTSSLGIALRYHLGEKLSCQKRVPLASSWEKS